MKNRWSVIILFVISLMFLSSCEKIDSFIEKNTTDAEKNVGGTEKDTSGVSSDLGNSIDDGNGNNTNLTGDYFWQKEMTDDTVAVIIDKITDEEYSSLSNVETVQLDDSTDGVVVVAATDDMDMEIWSLSYEGNELLEKAMVHKRENMKINEAIKIQTSIPEGIANYKIKGSCSKGDFEYIINEYDGKNGRKHLQYISYGVDGDNADSKETKVKSMKCRLFFFDSADFQEYYIDKDIDVEDKAVIKALTKELKKATEYDSNFLELSGEVGITSAKVENGILKVEFDEDYTSLQPLGSNTEEGLLNSIIDTFAYNLDVDKVAIYFGDKLYTGVKGELEEGYFKVNFGDAKEFN